MPVEEPHVWCSQDSVVFLSGQQGNLSSSTRLLGRVFQHFDQASTVCVWPHVLAFIQATLELQGLFLAQICIILMIEKHKMTECL